MELKVRADELKKTKQSPPPINLEKAAKKWDVLLNNLMENKPISLEAAIEIFNNYVNCLEASDYSKVQLLIGYMLTFSQAKKISN